MQATLAALGATFQALLGLCPCEPRRPRGETQAVPCGARPDIRLLGLHLDLPGSALSGYAIMVYVFMLKYKRLLFRLKRLVIPQEKKRIGSTTPRRFYSCLDERAPARRGSAGLHLPTPMPTRLTTGGAVSWSCRFEARGLHHGADGCQFFQFL